MRARSDAEAAEQMCTKQQREMERLKRELSRAVRSSSPGPGSGADVSEQIYRDNALDKPSSTHRTAPLFPSRLSEEKENVGDPDGAPTPRRSKMTSPPPHTTSRTGSGYAGQQINSGRDSRESGRDSRDGMRSGGGGTGPGGQGGGGDGIESWKRAAEVTSQLKARIEQMKVPFPFSSFPFPLSLFLFPFSSFPFSLSLFLFPFSSSLFPFLSHVRRYEHD